MKSYQVSALKFRPQSFEEVVGQESITDTLEKVLSSQKISKSFLFCGPRGVGKTTCARILAKRIIQLDADIENDDLSFNLFELDAASNNSVEDIRSINEQVRITPQKGRYKVYIIDEVHMLSKSAFNAFLKTLEEPPPHVVFILATTEKNKIIPTILSRCQIYEFKNISTLAIQDYLIKLCKKQEIQYEKEALFLIAQKSEGGLRDALSLFDRLCSFCSNNLLVETISENLNVLDDLVYLKLVNQIFLGQLSEVILEFDKILSKGIENQYFISGLSAFYRNLILSKDPKTIPLLEINESLVAKLQELSKKVPLPYLVTSLELINSCCIKLKQSINKRFEIELCLMQLCSLHNATEKKKAT